MTIGTLAVIILINSIVQSSILPYFALFGHSPNTGLIMVVIVSLRQGKYYGSFFGLFLGIMLDIICGQVVGVNAFIFFIFGYSLGIIQEVLDVENIVIPILSSIIGTIFYNFLYYLIMYFLSKNISINIMIKNIFTIEILYNSIFTGIIYKMFSKIFVIPDLRFGKRLR